MTLSIKLITIALVIAIVIALGHLYIPFILTIWKVIIPIGIAITMWYLMKNKK